MLTLALGMLVWRALQQRRLSKVTTLTGTSGSHRAQQSGWRSRWAVIGGVWLVMTAWGIVQFPVRVSAWQDAKAARAGKSGTTDRLELADRTGTHLLAVNIQAYDLWLRPSEFSAASWANPKPDLDDSSAMTDVDRENALLPSDRGSSTFNGTRRAGVPQP